MVYDYQGAIDAGANPSDVLDYLGKQNNYDTQGAITAGAKPEDVMAYLANKPSPDTTVSEPPTDKFQNDPYTHPLRYAGNAIADAASGGVEQFKQGLSEAASGTFPIEPALKMG